MRNYVLICLVCIGLQTFSQETTAPEKTHERFSVKTYLQTYGAANTVYNVYSNNIFAGYNMSYFGSSIAFTKTSFGKRNFHQFELNNFTFNRFKPSQESTSSRFYGTFQYSYNISLRKKSLQENPFQMYLGLIGGLGYNYMNIFNSGNTNPKYVQNTAVFISGVDFKMIYNTKSKIYFEFGLPIQFSYGIMRDNESHVGIFSNQFVPVINPRIAIGFKFDKKVVPMKF